MHNTISSNGNVVTVGDDRYVLWGGDSVTTPFGVFALADLCAEMEKHGLGDVAYGVWLALVALAE